MNERDELEQLMPPGLMELLDYASQRPKETTTYVPAVIHLPPPQEPGDTVA